MARVISNPILKGLQGKIGKEVVFKRYGNKTIATKYPDMSKVKPSKLQKQKRSKFAEAVAYAKKINDDPQQKAKYQKKVKKGQTVFIYAVREYLKNNSQN